MEEVDGGVHHSSADRLVVLEVDWLIGGLIIAQHRHNSSPFPNFIFIKIKKWARGNMNE